jgi:hypothetical protein
MHGSDEPPVEDNAPEDDPALKEFFTPPESLYHYTTAGGFEGIVSSASLWATDISFLNDARELHYGFDLMRKTIQELRSASDASVIEQFSLDSFSNSTSFRAFVSCFCEDGDLLSQWRGYSGAGGYAIGFDGHALQNNLESQPRRLGWLHRVVYDEANAERMAKVWAKLMVQGWDELRDKLLGSNLTEDDAGRYMYEFHGRHMTASAKACLVLKDPSFSEEKEWRIILVVQPAAVSAHGVSVLFRQGAIGLVPYISVDLRASNGLLPIKRVVIGPGADSDRRALAARMLLETAGYSSVEVIESKVPYRTT